MQLHPIVSYLRALNHVSVAVLKQNSNETVYIDPETLSWTRMPCIDLPFWGTQLTRL